MGIKNPHTENKKFSVLKISKRQKEISNKKTTLAKQGKRTRWAPAWAVFKKFGVGKRIHPSAITRYKRSWRRTKIHALPRIQRKSHMG
jgi:ribosomal protein L39E